MTVPAEIVKLASLSPSFSPTPPVYRPPDGFKLHQELSKFKKSLAWKIYFRKTELKNSQTIDEFINQEITEFVKTPWYAPSTKEPPPLPSLLESAYQTVYKTIMDPANWSKVKPNLPPDQIKALKAPKNENPNMAHVIVNVYNSISTLTKFVI